MYRDIFSRFDTPIEWDISWLHSFMPNFAICFPPSLHVSSSLTFIKILLICYWWYKITSHDDWFLLIWVASLPYHYRPGLSACHVPFLLSRYCMAFSRIGIMLCLLHTAHNTFGTLLPRVTPPKMPSLSILTYIFRVFFRERAFIHGSPWLLAFHICYYILFIADGSSSYFLLSNFNRDTAISLLSYSFWIS